MWALTMVNSGNERRRRELDEVRKICGRAGEDLRERLAGFESRLEHGYAALTITKNEDFKPYLLEVD